MATATMRLLDGDWCRAEILFREPPRRRDVEDVSTLLCNELQQRRGVTGGFPCVIWLKSATYLLSHLGIDVRVYSRASVFPRRSLPNQLVN